jgi:rare lipoprotein A (peptidoglycan hydrolase)
VPSVARRLFTPLAFVLGGLTLAGCGGSPMGALDPIMSRVSGEEVKGRKVIGEPYRVGGRWYHPKEDPDYDEVGMASWYGPKFHGKTTANGERFNQHALTAAHPTLPLPSFARVTALKTGRSIVVRLNDRGPFKHGRIIDVSRAAADKLGFRRAGKTKVRVEYLGPAPVDGGDRETKLAAAKYGTRSKEDDRSLAGFLPFGRGKADRRDADDDAVRLAAAPAVARGDTPPGARTRTVKAASSAPAPRARTPAAQPEPAKARKVRTARAEAQATGQDTGQDTGETVTAYAEQDRAEESAAVGALITLNAEPQAENAGPAPEPSEALPAAERSVSEKRIRGAHDLFAAIDSASGGAGELRGVDQPE